MPRFIFTICLLMGFCSVAHCQVAKPQSASSVPVPSAVQADQTPASVQANLALQSVSQFEPIQVKKKKLLVTQPAKQSAETTQVKFTGPIGMKVFYQTGKSPDGKAEYSKAPIDVPGRHNFAQGAVYRIKLTDIEDYPKAKFFATIEVMRANAKTKDFLSHSAVSVLITTQELERVLHGGYMTKVIYMPDPKYQDNAAAGLEEILTTRLDPGQDPIRVAGRRGSILLVIRMGNRQE